MNDYRDPTELEGLLGCLDHVVIMQLWNVAERRQRRTPTAEHQQLLDELKVIRDRIAHGILPHEKDRESTRRLIRELVQLERGSLGAPAVRRVRRRTPAAKIDEILTRAEGPTLT